MTQVAGGHAEAGELLLSKKSYQVVTSAAFDAPLTYGTVSSKTPALFSFKPDFGDKVRGLQASSSARYRARKYRLELL